MYERQTVLFSSVQVNQPLHAMSLRAKTVLPPGRHGKNPFELIMNQARFQALGNTLTKYVHTYHMNDRIPDFFPTLSALSRQRQANSIL